jgi:hypothetical protein
MNQSAGALCYRVWQFFTALRAQVSDEELSQIARVLTPASLALFRSMAIQDQRHSLDVYTTLQQAGHTNPHLLTAALLHDVGKSITRLYPWQRAIIVLLDRFSPRLAAYLSRSDGLPDQIPSPLEGCTPDWPKGWRRAFIANAHHAEIGARWAQEAGCSSQSISLIRRHQDRLEKDPSPANERDQLLTVSQELPDVPQRLLIALQEADNLN